jgi:hypothetical protein
MNKLAFTFGILTAALLVPTGAFAHDKHRNDYDDHQAQIEADRRANGYYNPPAYNTYRAYDNCAPRYDSGYRYGYDRNGVRDDRGAVWIRVR